MCICVFEFVYLGVRHVGSLFLRFLYDCTNGWDGSGIGWDLCVGLLYEHRFAVLINESFVNKSIHTEWASSVCSCECTVCTLVTFFLSEKTTRSGAKVVSCNDMKHIFVPSHSIERTIEFI